MALVVTPSSPTPGVSRWVYDNLDTADSSPEAILAGGTQPALGAIQAVGTFGGGTVALQGSNDNSNWVNLPSSTGVPIALTSAGGVDFNTSFMYIRPKVTGGTGDDIDVFIVLRG